MGDQNDEIMRGTDNRGTSDRGINYIPKKKGFKTQNRKKIKSKGNTEDDSKLISKSITDIDLQLILLPTGSDEWNILLDKKKAILEEETNKMIEKLPWNGWPNKQFDRTSDLLSKPLGGNLNQRIIYVMTLLINQYHFPVNGACGLVGNLIKESGLIPNRLEGSLENTPMKAPIDKNKKKYKFFSAIEIMNGVPYFKGVGIAQWTYWSRRRGLFLHPFQGVIMGPNILFNMDAQIDYLVNELRSLYKGVYQIIYSHGATINESSDKVLLNFEMPGSIFYPKPNNKLRRPLNDPQVQGKITERRKISQAVHRIYCTANP
jgi:hypothetical protein